MTVTPKSCESRCCIAPSIAKLWTVPFPFALPEERLCRRLGDQPNPEPFSGPTRIYAKAMADESPGKARVVGKTTLH